MSGEQASADPLVAGGGRGEAVATTSGSSTCPGVSELPAGEVFSALGTSRRGLPRAQAQDRLEKYGAQRLTVRRALRCERRCPAATPLISLIEEAAGATVTVALLRLSRAGVDVIQTAITPQSGQWARLWARSGSPRGRLWQRSSVTDSPPCRSPAIRLRAGDELLLVSHSATEQEIHAAFQ